MSSKKKQKKINFCQVSRRCKNTNLRKNSHNKIFDFQIFVSQNLKLNGILSIRNAKNGVTG